MAEHYRDLIRSLMRHGFSFKRQGAGSDEIWWNRSSGGEVTLDRNVDSRAAATAVLVNAGIEKAEKPSAKPAVKPAAKTPAKPTGKSGAKPAGKSPAKAPTKKAAAAKAGPKKKSVAKTAAKTPTKAKSKKSKSKARKAK